MGKKLKKAMVDAGISQKNLAEKVHVSVSHLSRIANGRLKPSERLLTLLAIELDCKPEDLI